MMKKLLQTLTLSIAAGLSFGAHAQFSNPTATPVNPVGFTRRTPVNIQITNPNVITAELRFCSAPDSGCDPTLPTASVVTPSSIDTGSGLIIAQIPDPGNTENVQGHEVEWVVVINPGTPQEETSAVQTYHIANPGSPTNVLATTNGTDSTVDAATVTFTYDGDGLDYTAGTNNGTIQIRYCNDPNCIAATMAVAPELPVSGNAGTLTVNVANSAISVDNGDGTFDITVTDAIPAMPDGTEVIWGARLSTTGAVRFTVGNTYTTQAGVALSLNDFNTQDISSQIYPSPAVDVLNIGEAVETETYQVIDISGATVLTVDATTANGSINVANLSSGIYFLVTDAGVAKFVKQ